MRVSSKAILSLAMAFSVAGCASQAPRGNTTAIPDANSAGAQAYAGRCGTCHALPHPKRLGYEGWQAVLPVMEQRIEERGMVALGEQEREAILNYLRDHAR